MGTGKLNAGANPAMDWHPIQRGVEVLPVASYYSNREKFRPDEPLGSSSHLTLLYNQNIILIYQRKNSDKMLQNVMSYISTIRKQTMPLWEPSRYRDKIFSKS